MIDVDSETLKVIEDWGKVHGWQLSETIRYILGEKLFSLLNPIGPVGIGKILKPEDPYSLTEHFPKTNKGDEPMRQMANIVASQGIAKCRNCLKVLTSDEIMAGECSDCGEKI